MGELWDSLPGFGLQRFALDAAWQSTLVCLMALGLARVVRRRPALRAALLLAAGVLCVVAPVASAAARFGGWGILTSTASTESVKAFGAIPMAVERPSSPAVHAATMPVAGTIPVAVAMPNVRARTSVFGWTGGVLGVLWCVASAVLLLRLLRSAFAVRRACRLGQPCEDAEIVAALGQASRTIGVVPPLLIHCADVDSPALVSWGRPRLLLPAGCEPRSDWFAIFCHELAHLARRDGWSRLAVEAVTIALPWQPLVWVVRRDFRAACEEACDDWAIASGADPVEFASLLLDFVPQARTALVLGMAESVSAARARIVRLLAMQDLPRPRLGRLLGVSGWVMALGLVVILALLQTGKFPWRGNDLPPWGNAPVNMATAFDKESPADRPPLKPYTVDAPDILLIDATKVVPKPPYRIEPLDTLEIFVLGTVPDQNIAGPYPVEADGTVMLGPAYGAIKVSELSLGEARDAIKKHLEGIVKAPQVSVSLSESAGQQQIEGEHLIGPDGTVNLGSYGSVYVAGMTIPDVRKAIELHLSQFLDKPRISVDMHAYNSKNYYIVSEREGMDYISRVPCTGRERVLDALSKDSNVRLSPTGWVWIARPGAESGKPTILPVDWRALLRGESNKTNYWIEPGDQVFVQEK